MISNLTNLLSDDRRRALKRTYYFRVATLATLSIAVLFLANAALLAPSYIYATQNIATEEARLAELSVVASTTQERPLSERMSALAESAGRVHDLISLPSASAAVRGILSVPQTGIALTRISVTPANEAGGEGKMELAGTAASRESLKSYRDALGALPYVSDAALPLSAYASDSAIPFTISITGTLTP